MSRTVYVNGEFIPEEDAKVSIFDRGFVFSDAVYEVTSVVNGKMIDNDVHLARLKRSLNELDIATPMDDDQFLNIHQQLIEKNNIKEGLVYLQVSRGSADRDFCWFEEMKPTVVMYTQQVSIIDNPKSETGLTVITLPDIRWQRCDIKTVGLLAASMAKMQAKAQGADDAWLYESDRMITEGSSNNAYIVTEDDKIITRESSNKILTGITRRALLAFAKASGLTLEERSFSIDEAYDAKEAFLSSATTFVLPVVKIDDKTIGDGLPGAITKKLRALYIDMASNQE